MKMKEIGPSRGASLAPPTLDPPMKIGKTQTKSFQQESETKRNRQIHRILLIEFILDPKTIALVLSETCRSG